MSVINLNVQDKSIFSRSELEVVLKAIETKSFVKFQINDELCRAQSIILGGDLLDNKLLISEPYPSLQFSQCEALKGQLFWIQLIHDNEILSLHVKLLERVGQHLMVYVLGTQNSDNRRWFPRAHFKRHRGPQVKLALDHNPNAAGFLKNISTHGLAIDFWNKDLRDQFRKNSIYEPAIRFNEQFTLTAKYRVLESRLHRDPCCHTQIRFQLIDTNALQQNQITAFIDSFCALSDTGSFRPF